MAGLASKNKGPVVTSATFSGRSGLVKTDFLDFIRSRYSQVAEATDLSWTLIDARAEKAGFVNKRRG